MTNVLQSFANYKERMKNTFYFSITPLSLLISLFSARSSGDYSSFSRGLSLFFGVVSSPVLLLATPVTIGLGALAAIAQTLFFPFQLLYSAIQDARSSSPLKDEQNANLSSYNDHYEEHADDLSADAPSIGDFKTPLFSYAPLFNQKDQTIESKEGVLSPVQSMSL